MTDLDNAIKNVHVLFRKIRNPHTGMVTGEEIAGIFTSIENLNDWLEFLRKEVPPFSKMYNNSNDYYHIEYKCDEVKY